MSSSKIKISSILKKNLNPTRLWTIYKLQKNKKKTQRVYNDAQLKLYAQMLPQGFLHYGYFEDPSILPEDMSFNLIEKAQLQYALNIIHLIITPSQPVLDIGCGMGGLLKILIEKNIPAIALTPDINQAKYVQETYPSCESIHAKFEDIDKLKYANYFSTLITSESLQYLDLAVSLPIINIIMKQDGRWIACDYFRIGEAHEKSGHDWQSFVEQLDKHNLKIVYEQDITNNILPTIQYIYLWAKRIGLPIKDFIVDKIKTKQPGIYYAMEELIPQLDQSIHKNIDTINPTIFKQQKQYKLLVFEKK